MKRKALSLLLAYRLLYNLLPEEGVLVPDRDNFTTVCFSHLIYDGIRDCLSSIQDQLDILRTVVKRIYQSAEYICQLRMAAAEHDLENIDDLQPDTSEYWYSSMRFLSRVVRFRRPIEALVARESNLREGVCTNMIKWNCLEGMSSYHHGLFPIPFFFPSCSPPKIAWSILKLNHRPLSMVHALCDRNLTVLKQGRHDRRNLQGPFLVALAFVLLPWPPSPLCAEYCCCCSTAPGGLL